MKRDGVLGTNGWRSEKNYRGTNMEKDSMMPRLAEYGICMNFRKK